MHADSGNSGSSDFPGPLGCNATTSSAQTLGIFFYARDGRLTAGHVNTESGQGSVQFGLSALDPDSFQVLSTWFPPIANETLGITYLEYLLDTDDIITSSTQGRIYVVHREPTGSEQSFTTKRVIDISSHLQSPQGQLGLLNTMIDSSGNIWFTSGDLHLAKQPTQNTTIVGYVTPDDSVVKKVIPNSMVENGIAVHEDAMFMVTSPAGATDKANATGYLWSFKAKNGKVDVRWQAPYEAGSFSKPGSFARGCGSTPALLDNHFVAITDNKDVQINLNVFHQAPHGGRDEQQLLCKMPLFEPGASSNDIAVTVHKDGDKYGLVILNDYNGPTVLTTPGKDFELNGEWNDMTPMAKGVVRVDVDPTEKSCNISWTVDQAWKTVPVLSTKTGLLYGYTQDPKLAEDGKYIWYFVAVDWITGKVVWQKRAGAGGAYNDNWAPTVLTPDGRLIQTVWEGIAVVGDEEVCQP